jgi:hypothetical protein
MIGKRIQIDDQMWQAINLLRQERRRSFQQLATEALRDLLEKHHRPVSLKDQLEESLVEVAAKSYLDRSRGRCTDPRFQVDEKPRGET